MNFSNKYTKILLFTALLIASNLYLFKSGYWFAQDTSYWPKNNYESLTMLLQQFNVFTNFGYYIGFDQGLFNFTRIVMISIISLSSYIFGFSNSQLFFSLIGYIITFFSFYLFSGIIFKNKNTRYVISLLYTFHPLTHTLQGYAIYNSAVPLFLYSFNIFFNNSRRINYLSLIINVFSSFIWIAYIRFFQGNFFIVIPYIIYLITTHKIKFSHRKLLLFLLTYVLIFLPVIYSVIIQILERSQTAFNYGAILGKFTPSVQFTNSFNLIQSIGVNLYAHRGWTVLGLSFFAILIVYLIKRKDKNDIGIIYLNLFLVLISITLYGLSNIFGESVYQKIINFFPFIINAPFFALYIQHLPFVVLAGLLLENRKRTLYFFVYIYILASLTPLLNLNSKDFNNFHISNAPKPYMDYFIKPNYGIAESTYYYIDTCWRAKYMDSISNTNICLNFGLKYSSATLSDPRLVSGDKYNISSILKNQTMLDNLRVTHNLKNIILPIDLINKDEIMISESAKEKFDKNPHLIALANENFIHYKYSDSKSYDFFIYSPKKIIYSADPSSISDNSIKAEENPVILDPSISDIGEIKSAQIAYKINPLKPSTYYLHLNGFNASYFLQFNQAYQNTWKIKLVDKELFDRYNCSSAWEKFQHTNNKRCIYDYSFFDFNQILILLKPEMKNSQHVKSNYISNGWLIEDNENSDMYVVIVNEKQIYYNIATIISLTAVLILLLTWMTSKIKHENN